MIKIIVNEKKFYVYLDFNSAFSFFISYTF